MILIRHPYWRIVIFILTKSGTMSILVLMGVCGSGKTTVAKHLSEKLNCTYRDADDFHSKENKLKMASGIPLTDEFTRGQYTGIVTCSALKRLYRNILLHGSEALTLGSTGSQAMTNNAVLFVYLKGSPELISARLNGRKGHFMPPRLLESQFDILEDPDDSERHITVDIDCSVETLVDSILKRLIK